MYQITVFLQQNTTASLLELYLNDSMQTVYVHIGGGGGGSQQREVADGANVVFTDTGHFYCRHNGALCFYCSHRPIVTNFLPLAELAMIFSAAQMQFFSRLAAG